jgi:putative addiction module component (TIGR02574 family)
MAHPKRIDDLRQGALALSPAERRALAADLMDSVVGADPEWEQAFARELDRRSKAYRSGADPGVPWTELRGTLLRQKS